jgi:hypothetical protein
MKKEERHLTGACIDEKDARQREKYLKSGMGKKYIRSRIKKYLENL